MANRPAPDPALREGDRQELTRWTCSTSMRAGLVMWSAVRAGGRGRGEANSRIARRECTTRTTVIKWRSRYQDKGLGGMGDEPRPARRRHMDHRDAVAAAEAAA